MALYLAAAVGCPDNSQHDPEQEVPAWDHGAAKSLLAILSQTPEAEADTETHTVAAVSARASPAVVVSHASILSTATRSGRP
jgi:hypothetical protein